MYISSRRIQRLSLSCPHEIPNVPNTEPLVPSGTGHPSFIPKQAPINPAHELRMPAHPPQLPALLTGMTFGSGMRRLRLGGPIRPDPTRHIIARAE